MTAYPGTIPLFFSIDSDHPINTAPLNISLDGGKTFTLAATPVSSPSSRQIAQPPRPAAGSTRYWWTLMAGVGEQLPLSCGPNVFYGQLTDGSAVVPQVWQQYLQYIPV